MRVVRGIRRVCVYRMRGLHWYSQGFPEEMVYRGISGLCKGVVRAGLMTKSFYKDVAGFFSG